ESLLVQRQEIEKSLRGLVGSEALVGIGGQVPKFADTVSAQLNQTRMLIAHELQDLRDMALKLSSRFDPEHV
ncbi:MAG TPA: hypothetical protein VE553_06780, partial [Candidatus Binatia bacterium]|nr:hypothetical protein [Candidatus Binatia bacterium]